MTPCGTPALTLYGFDFEIVCRHCDTQLGKIDIHDNLDGTYALVCSGCGHAAFLDQRMIERMVVDACNGDTVSEF
jgi:hypothetical protein